VHLGAPGIINIINIIDTPSAALVAISLSVQVVCLSDIENIRKNTH
jgi:hypothetical protein